LSTRKPSEKLTNIIAENIRLFRKTNNISQEEFADMCGLHRTYIGSIERSERNLTLSTLELIAETMSTNVQSLLAPNLGLNND